MLSVNRDTTVPSMAEKRHAVMLSGTQLLFHRYLSLSSSNDNIGDTKPFHFADDFVFTIPPSLLVDSAKVKIGQMIGEGPHSIVYEGWYEARPVAVKVILPYRTCEASPECKEKFQREVMLLSKIRHENVVEFVGASVDPTMMIVTELLRGGSLRRHLKEMYPTSLGLKLSISYALDISRGMEYLHATGIIHRDLKPGNLLLTEDKKHIKIGDFGVAREVTYNDDMTCEAGTYRWMAPELFSKDPLPKGAKKCYDHKADVYSFAIVMWTLITNRIPFRGRSDVMAAYASAENIRPSVDDFPNDVVPLIQSCWAAEPAQRPEFKDITKTLTTLFHSCCSSSSPTPSLTQLIPDTTDTLPSASGPLDPSPSPGPVTNTEPDVAKKPKEKRGKRWYFYFMPFLLRCFRN